MVCSVQGPGRKGRFLGNLARRDERDLASGSIRTESKEILGQRGLA